MSNYEVVNKLVENYKTKRIKEQIQVVGVFSLFVLVTFFVVMWIFKPTDQNLLNQFNSFLIQFILSSVLMVVFFSAPLLLIHYRISPEFYRERINNSNDNMKLSIVEFYSIYFKMKNKTISDEDLKTLVERKIEKEKLEALSKNVYVGNDKDLLESSKKKSEEIANEYDNNLVQLKLSKLVYSILVD